MMRRSVALAAILAASPIAAPAQPGSWEVAEVELQVLANALTTVAIDTTYFTTLENLDDLSSVTTTNPFDYINHEGGALVLEPFGGRFRDPARLNLLTRPPGLNWQGPYVNYQPSRIDGPDSDYDEGTPLDPWGNPYYLYSPLGLVEPRSQLITQRDYGDFFSQWTVVSLGPDGIVSGDDLTRTFGGYAITVAAISSVRLTPGDGIVAGEARGYNMGAEQGTGRLEMDDVEIATIASWSTSSIAFTLPSLPADEEVVFRLVAPNGQQDEVVGYVLESESSRVGSWDLY